MQVDAEGIAVRHHNAAVRLGVPVGQQVDSHLVLMAGIMGCGNHVIHGMHNVFNAFAVVGVAVFFARNLTDGTIGVSAVGIGALR